MCLEFLQVVLDRTGHHCGVVGAIARAQTSNDLLLVKGLITVYSENLVVRHFEKKIWMASGKLR
jgi:hypothetical protein